MKIKLLILLFVVLSLLFTVGCSKTEISEEKSGEQEETEEEPETGIDDVFEESEGEVTQPPAPPV